MVTYPVMAQVMHMQMVMGRMAGASIVMSQVSMTSPVSMSVMRVCSELFVMRTM